MSIMSAARWVAQHAHLQSVSDAASTNQVARSTCAITARAIACEVEQANVV